MPLIKVRGDAEQLAVWLVKRQLADVTPHVAEYGPAQQYPEGAVRVRRIPGTGGLANEFGVEQVVIEINGWAWAISPATVNARQHAFDLVSTAQSALLLAQRNATPTPFGSITRWQERTAPFENRNGRVSDGQTWVQATCALTVIPPLTPVL